MTTPDADLDLALRLHRATERGLRDPLRKGPALPSFDARRAKGTKARYAAAGLAVVGLDSTTDDVEHFVQRLEDQQEAWLFDLTREWALNWLMCAGYQHVTWHNGRKMYVNRSALPWRVRATYNVCAGAQALHVARLTEQKPTVTVQARSMDTDDVERAEYKESLFWYLWDRLQVLDTLKRARRHAYLAGSAFIKTGWDPGAGDCFPRTVKRVRYEYVTPDNAPPGTPPQQVVAGTDEFYVDKAGEVVGPVWEMEEVQGERLRVRRDPPEGTDWFYRGEVFAEFCPAVELLFDRYADSIEKSWYVVHRRVLPLSRILALYPDADAATIREATPADPAQYVASAGAFGLAPWANTTGLVTPRVRQDGQARDTTDPDPAYRVVEVWIWPESDDLRRLWGARGAKITTIGGKMVGRPQPLPEWALTTRPFIQVLEEAEDGNHYGKPPMRDLRGMQHDINRTLSLAHEGFLVRARLLLWGPQSSGLSMRVMSGFPAMYVQTRSRDAKPEVIQLGDGPQGWQELFQASLSAFADLAHRNDASAGKLPSASIPAKAIYALQYADERSINEIAGNQDKALKQLAESLDAITRVEYSEGRKIEIVGMDRAFMAEHEITPEDLAIDVNYTFQPGSMLARQKESVKNELLELMKAGLVSPDQVRRNLPSAVPELFRLESDLQYAHARWVLDRMLNGASGAEPQPHQPEPWEAAAVHKEVLEEWLLTERSRQDSAARTRVATTWQVYAQMVQAQSAPPGSPAAGAGAGGPPGGPPGGGSGGPPPGGNPLPPPPGMPPNPGADALEMRATQEMEHAPPGAGEVAA